MANNNNTSSYYTKGENNHHVASIEDETTKSDKDELAYNRERRMRQSAITRHACSMSTMFTTTIAILVIISSLAPILIMIITERKNVDGNMRQINSHVIDRVTQQVNNQLSETAKTTVALRQLVLKNSQSIVQDFKNSRWRIIELIWGIVDEFPVASMFVVSKDNSALGIVRDEGGVPVILDKWYRDQAVYWGPINLEKRMGMNNNYSTFPGFQPSQRIYWKTVTRARQNTWSGFFLAGINYSPLMSYVSPIFNESAPSDDGKGELIGATVSFVNLTGFFTFLDNLSLGGNGVAYTMEPSGLLISSGDPRVKLFNLMNSQVMRTNATTCKNTLMASSARYILDNREKFASSRSVDFFLTPEKGLHLMGSAYLYSEPGLELYLVTVLKRKDFLGNTVVVNSLSITISFCLILFSIAYGIVFTVSVIRQIQILSGQMEKVSRMNLSGIDTTGSPNMITEIGAMQLSFWGMVASLREFKAFLPPGLVQDDDDEEGVQVTGNKVRPVEDHTEHNSSFLSQRISMSSDGGSTPSRMSSGDLSRLKSRTKFVLGVQLRDITLLLIQFDDINKSLQASSTLLDTSALITNQGIVLSTIDSIVSKHKGNIDDFDLGKLVISWNTVKNCMNSGLKAARAAHQIMKALQNMNRKNLVGTNQSLSSKFTMAISTGKAYVGNIGNKSMRKHMISGSVFSKIQAMSKLHAKYGTRILIDDRTGEEVKRTFHLRPVNIFEIANTDHYSIGEQTREKFGVLELVKTNEHQSDEWMYEMTSKNENEMWDMVRNSFYELLKENPDYDNIISKLDDYLKVNTSDQIVKDLKDDIYSASISRGRQYPITSLSSFSSTRKSLTSSD